MTRSYSLAAQSFDWTDCVEQVRIDVSAKWNTITATQSIGRKKIKYPLVLRPSEEARYFEVVAAALPCVNAPLPCFSQERPPVQWAAMLSNPMALMMIFMLAMVLIMPQMIDSMGEFPHTSLSGEG